MLAITRRASAVSACFRHRQAAMLNTTALSTGSVHGSDEGAERPTHIDPHWGPLDVPDEPPEVVVVEEQHGQHEPPSQKPPMWFIQVPAQVNNFDAECMLPPQVPPRHTDHLRYPDTTEAGVEQKYPDPYDPAPRVEVAVERNIKIAKDKLPPDTEIISRVVDVRELLKRP